jgi:hypothetical protein
MVFRTITALFVLKSAREYIEVPDPYLITHRKWHKSSWRKNQYITFVALGFPSEFLKGFEIITINLLRCDDVVMKRLQML